MVEPQCGSSDITQSTAAKDSGQGVEHQPDAAQSLEARLGGRGLSCVSPRLVRMSVNPIQMAK